MTKKNSNKRMRTRLDKKNLMILNDDGRNQKQNKL